MHIKLACNQIFHKFSVVNFIYIWKMNGVGANDWVFQLVYFIGCLHLVLTFSSVGWGYTSVNDPKCFAICSKHVRNTIYINFWKLKWLNETHLQHWLNTCKWFHSHQVQIFAYWQSNVFFCFYREKNNQSYAKKTGQPTWYELIPVSWATADMQSSVLVAAILSVVIDWIVVFATWCFLSYYMGAFVILSRHKFVHFFWYSQ